VPPGITQHDAPVVIIIYRRYTWVIRDSGSKIVVGVDTTYPMEMVHRGQNGGERVEIRGFLLVSTYPCIS
jgi:hypothetical protein